MKARTFIITIGAVGAIAAPAAHAATATNALHCSVKVTPIAIAYPTPSMGFRALQSAGKSQKPIGNRCTSKSSKTVVVSKRLLPVVHKPLIRLCAHPPAVAAPRRPTRHRSMASWSDVDESYVARGYLCSGTDPLAPADGPSVTGDGVLNLVRLSLALRRRSWPLCERRCSAPEDTQTQASAEHKEEPMLHELNTREGDGITVTLYWDGELQRTMIRLLDDRTGTGRDVRVPAFAAADAFDHPF